MKVWHRTRGILGIYCRAASLQARETRIPARPLLSACQEAGLISLGATGRDMQEQPRIDINRGTVASSPPIRTRHWDPTPPWWDGGCGRGRLVGKVGPAALSEAKARCRGNERDACRRRNDSGRHRQTRRQTRRQRNLVPAHDLRMTDLASNYDLTTGCRGLCVWHSKNWQAKCSAPKCPRLAPNCLHNLHPEMRKHMHIAG